MTEESVKLLIKKRGILKASITRVNIAVANFNRDSDDKHSLNVRLKSLRNLAIKYDEIQSMIETQSEDAETASKDRVEIDEVLYNTECNILRLLETCETQTEPHSASNNIQLQPIKLPCFSGNVLEWQHFYAMFTDLIHVRTDLNATQKLHYLHSSLRDEPLNLIKNLPICSENYQIALDLLSSRYENKLIISSYHVKNILGIKALDKESVLAISNFISTVSSSVSSLRAMSLSVDPFELILTQFLTSKLDSTTCKLWKESLNDNNLPTFDTFIQFLKNRRQVLENTMPKVDAGQRFNKSFLKSGNRSFSVSARGSVDRGACSSYHTAVKIYPCCYCRANHAIYRCDKFMQLSVIKRKEHIEKSKCCINCLSPRHSLSGCKSKQTCRVCSNRHHTLLHAPPIDRNDAGSTYCSLKLQASKNIILSTAVALVTDRAGNRHPARILLDAGSQANFCTREFAKKLQLQLYKANIPIAGINNATCYADNSVAVQITSRYQEFTFIAQCAVLSNLTHKLPSQSFDVTSFNIPGNLFLADPCFNISSDIDILLGAQFYLSLIQPTQFTRGPGFPVIQETRLGYILAGNLPDYCHIDGPAVSFLARDDDDRLSTAIERFWETETVCDHPSTADDCECERHFARSTVRNSQGRFVVSLPLVSATAHLGESYSTAESRFLNLERRFKRDPDLKIGYAKFIREYLELGHMSLIEDDDVTSSQSNIYYLPHHAVFKYSSSTTKLRVVFDGSAKTDNGLSLNDILMVGPTVQPDLFSILLRFRIHNYVLIADIEKMYRQILIDDNDCNLQRILWRDSPHESLRHFMLRTVTYGTASASFLATRCLVQIGRDNESSFPAASSAIINDFYVDDLLTGADTVAELMSLRADLSGVLRQYGFHLHKWSSNSPAVIPSSSHSSIPLNKEFSIRTLGILWDNRADFFRYEVKPGHRTNAIISKRTILSIIAGIYDPLGLLGPVVFMYKHFMQLLWLANIGWDDPLPGQLSSQWQTLHGRLTLISDIRIPRSIRCDGDVKLFELHGFADASMRGYGCCIYVRIVYRDLGVSCRLLCSKSRVAPLRQVSLPRGELCACLLLSRLLQRVAVALGSRVDSAHLYSDSMVSLHWIHAQSSRWKTYVSNRVAEIQQHTGTFTWHHIDSRRNPADLISRGCLPDALRDSQLWWHGPRYLSQYSEHPPLPPFAPSDVMHSACSAEERNAPKCSLASILPIDLSKGFSSLSRLTRVYSYCFRFIRNSQSSRSHRISGVLTPSEINHTLKFFVKLSQSICFNPEVMRIQSGASLPSGSKLAALNPFIDELGMLRVGGRLQHSQLPYDNKHPIILHPSAHITRLIIESEHLRLLHAGAQLTHHSLRQRWWIVNAKVVIRSVIRGCLPCFRFNVRKQSQQLGELPSSRVTPSRPFLCCAVDYGGPFMIRHGGQRSKALSKAYVSLFICLSTRAIHLELVSDLTAEAFIAALRRFMARRGIPSRIYSDNGTNFRKARNILRDLYYLWRSEDVTSTIQSFASSKGIAWSFIPPSSPHFGGLWESGIKSMKFHLRRVIGKSILTFEEFATVLSQVEACLNSRPLFAVSADPNDPLPLTPGHFLIGSPLTAIPDPDFSDIPISRLGRWQLLQGFVRAIWKSWSRDYLHQLQQRHKWKFAKENVSSGDLVLLIEDNLPPLSWKCGIITDTFPGPDKLVRVVNVRTPSGTFRRPVHKLCLLPARDE